MRSKLSSVFSFALGCAFTVVLLVRCGQPGSSGQPSMAGGNGSTGHDGGSMSTGTMTMGMPNANADNPDAGSAGATPTDAGSFGGTPSGLSINTLTGACSRQDSSASNLWWADFQAAGVDSMHLPFMHAWVCDDSAGTCFTSPSIHTQGTNAAVFCGGGQGDRVVLQIMQ